MRHASTAQLRVGLVGAGGIAPVHVQAWQAVGASVSVHSLVGADHLAKRYGLDTHASPDELMDRVDVVDVIAPTAAHRGVVLQAVQCGRPVVVEKPLAPALEDAIAIARASRSAGVPVFPAHVVRYFPEYVRLKEQVDSGRLGELAVLRFGRAGQAPRAGSWFYSEPDGGGIILDQMIHDLDQARWLAGEVTQVFAVQNPASTSGRTPGRVTAHVTLTHRSGAISTLQGVWGPAGMDFHTDFSVAGSTGCVRYDSRNGAVVRDVPGVGDSSGYLPARTTSAESPYTSEIRDFLRAITTATPARVTLEDGVMAVAIADACQQSVRSGRAVAVDAAAVLEQLRADSVTDVDSARTPDQRGREMAWRS